jgi:hypothetical protein
MSFWLRHLLAALAYFIAVAVGIGLAFGYYHLTGASLRGRRSWSSCSSSVLSFSGCAIQERRWPLRLRGVSGRGRRGIGGNRGLVRPDESEERRPEQGGAVFFAGPQQGNWSQWMSSRCPLG